MRFESRHLGFLTSVYLLTFDQHLNITTGIYVPENERIVVAIWFIVSVELKMYCMLYAVRKFESLLPVLSRHIGYLVQGARLVLLTLSCSPAISRKRRRSISVIQSPILHHYPTLHQLFLHRR